MRRLGVLLVAVALTATGCGSIMASRPANADLTGKWRGVWVGYGIDEIPRNEAATADLVQHGRHGSGRLVLDGTNAAESVPLTLRRAGLAGSRVEFEVDEDEVVMRHELGGHLFTFDFKVDGDRMLGKLRNGETPLRVVLERVRPERAAAPPPIVAAAPPPPPPAPAPLAPAPEPEPATPEPAAPAQPEEEPPLALAPAPQEQEAEPEPEERPAPAEFAAVAEVQPIHFDFDRADIRPADAAILDANLEWLKANAETLVLIEGHADERGTNEYNLALGERRAAAARDYLVARGVDADRISIVSFGEERPACAEPSEACWAENRRAVFLIKLR